MMTNPVWMLTETSLLLLACLVDKRLVDMGNYTTTSNGGLQKEAKG